MKKLTLISALALAASLYADSVLLNSIRSSHTAAAKTLATQAADPQIEELLKEARRNKKKLDKIERVITTNAIPESVKGGVMRSSLYDRLAEVQTNLASWVSKEQIARQLAELNARLATAYSNRYEIAQGLYTAAQSKIEIELADLREEKTDLEEKIADSKYILLRSWLKAKLALVEARIARLEALTSSNN